MRNYHDGRTGAQHVKLRNTWFEFAEDLESLIYSSIIAELDLCVYQDMPVIIKGCSNKPVPANALVLLSQKLKPIAKSIMFGEACSSVPLFKRKK